MAENSIKIAKVSVILTSWNRDKLLRSAIKSVVNNNYPYYHLYVVDDDSDNPKTHNVLNDYEDHPNITIFRYKLDGIKRYSRTGYAVNINKILEKLRHTNTKYITYLTCDDIFLPGRLEKMVHHLDNNPKHFIVYGVQRVVRLNANFTVTPLFIRNCGEVVPNAACRVDHNSIMHRIECVRKFEGRLWCEHISNLGAGDACVWKKLNRYWPFYRLKDITPTDEHRLHKGSIQKL